MRRLCIIVIYDDKGVIDNYIIFLLEQMKKICQSISIIINGNIRAGSLNILKGYSENVYIRENVGFDAGAYKDAFLKLIPLYKWMEFDEIFLMNDTFFGPVLPLDNLLHRFSDETIDFWGITRHPTKRSDEGKTIYSHIQAYFLAIKKRMFVSPQFLEFWSSMEYPQNYQEAIWNFEIKFTKFFEDYGFCGKTLMDFNELDDYDINPYLYNSYEIIKNMGGPFLKKKCLLFGNPGFINAIDAVEYIEKEYDYNIKLIWDNIFRLSKEKVFPSIFNYFELEQFYLSHKRLYIYGAGKFGQRIKRYFQYREWNYECFLVSEDENRIGKCKCYNDIHFESQDGIVLALGKRSLNEVYPKIKEKVNKSQLFFPSMY